MKNRINQTIQNERMAMASRLSDSLKNACAKLGIRYDKTPYGEEYVELHPHLSYTVNYIDVYTQGIPPHHPAWV